MDEQDASDPVDSKQQREFVRALLDDVAALERMIDEGSIEEGVRRIGAEQEIFLVDEGCEPAPRAVQVLDHLADPMFTTELANFNLEANLQPYRFEGNCLSRMEADLNRLLDRARESAKACGADVLLTGILPTLELSDLGLENMTPVPRYRALNDAIRARRGGSFEVRIKGIDELYAQHDNVMLESCNTSFQLHFQVGCSEFAKLYNLAQMVTAPVLAVAVNSPLLLGHRLWHETRVALFQHSVDDRSAAHMMRGRPPRVRFGEDWIDSSITEIFKDDIARFRVVLATDVEEKSLEMLDRGEKPHLRALCLHNGTVYRWNRPCYGLHEGVPHLRIENRVLPAGPTVVDEVANAALYYGLLAAVGDEHRDVTKVMKFDDAASNFLAAARHGLEAQLTWVGGRVVTASELLLTELIPQARAGLASHGVDSADINRYLGVLEERVKANMTGAKWMLNSFSAMQGRGSAHDRCRVLTAAMLARQKTGDPVHTWSPARYDEAPDWRHAYKTVGQYMTKDLYTVHPDDLVDLAAHQMSTKRIRHIPVEDDAGRCVGLVSHRTLIRLLAEGAFGKADARVAVSSIMTSDPVTVSPDTPTLDAIKIMREQRVGCLPVVNDDKLVGILTERDLIEVAAQLLEDHLKGFRT